GGGIGVDLEARQSPLRDFDSVPPGDNLFRRMNLEGIDHVAFAVPDVERTVAWYLDVLGFERRHEEAWDGVPAFIGKGTTAFALFPRKTTSSEKSDGSFLHLALRANRAEFVRAQEELRKRAIKFQFEDHGIAHSIYFRDLNGLRLEITTYELP
ncbi:MAG TPA: VOC family protein, partial [Chthoniobacterales bacterium]